MIDLYAFKRNVVLVASAGTGKTHALVGVILHALLGVSDLSREPVPPARIAATTFSRKAAAEIRDRLVTELELLAFGRGSPYDADLARAAQRREISWGPAAPVERATRALADVEQAMIGTLHGLAYSIARQNALRVGLPPSFAVASDEDTESWATEAVTLAMREHAARDADAIRDFLRLMRGTDRAQLELVRLLLALEEDGRSAPALTLPEGDATKLEAQMSRLLESARRLANDARFEDPARAVLDAHAANDVGALVSATADLFAIRKPRGEDDWLSLRDELPGATNRDRGEAFVHAWASRARVGATAVLVRDLLARAQSHLAAIEASAGAVGFGAALRLARDALRDDPMAAWRTSSSYDALLVDEFQDTSRVQVELLRLLWERDPRARAPGAMPVHGDFRAAGLLVVGDRKQSIYAFRGADVGVFVATCVELAGESARTALGVSESAAPLPVRTTADFFVLRENRRANGALIDFVNAFSRECLRAEGDDLAEARYVEETEALIASPQTRYVTGPRVMWIRPSGEARETARLDDAMTAAWFVAQAIEHDRRDDGSPLAFRDFAVLAQSNEMLDATAFAMSRAQIPHVVAGRGFFSAREVQDLLALLRWIDRPEDRVALLAILRGPCAALGDRTLIGLTEPHRGLVTDLERWTTLDRSTLIEDEDREPLERVRTLLRALRRSADRLGPGRVLREAVRELEIEQTLLLMPRGMQRIANVRKLLRIADGVPTTRALLDRVARAEARAREPEAATFSEDDDAVRLLTMHASKGLAFPIVILPELRASPSRSANTTIGLDLRGERAYVAAKALDDRGEPATTPSIQELSSRDRGRTRADRRRLLYVAVTRARERLVFIGGVKSASRTEPHLGAMIASLAAGPLLVSTHHSHDAQVEVRDTPASLDVTVPAFTPPDLALSATREPRTIEVAIAPTALQDFHHCPRRFELVHLFGLPEPTPTGLGRFRADGAAATNARAEGNALHRLLERVDAAAFGASDSERAAREALVATDAGLDAVAEARVLRAATRFLSSDYARTVRESNATLWREEAFVLSFASPHLTVTLRGAMDLVVRYPNGDIDVVDYKRSRGPDSRPHALQLDVYHVAARALSDAENTRVRVGAAFLGGDATADPRFRPPVTRARLEAYVLELATSLVHARRTKAFPRAVPKTCHAIGCGYFTLCHPAPTKKQLTLFR